MCKCRSTKFRKRLLAESNVTLEKALEIGRLMENADGQSQDIEASNGSSSRSNVAYLVNRVHKSKASGGTIKRSYPARQSSSVNSQVKSCYRCGCPAIWERFLIPALDEAVQGMHGAKFRSERGISSVRTGRAFEGDYHFSTHKGLFRYFDIFGMNTVFEVFQRTLQHGLSNCQGQNNI